MRPTVYFNFSNIEDIVSVRCNWLASNDSNAVDISLADAIWFVLNAFRNE